MYFGLKFAKLFTEYGVFEMGEIINVIDNIKENFESIKRKYPNLQDFHYDEATDTLSFNGATIDKAGEKIMHTDPIFFHLIPQDIFDYLKNNLYYPHIDLDKIKRMITTEMIITEDEITRLRQFVADYLRRVIIYNNNRLVFEQGIQDVTLNNFQNYLLECRKIIESIKTGIYHSVAASIILDEYNKLTAPITNIQQEINNENEQEKTKERELTLTRKKPNNNIDDYNFLSQDEINKQDERNSHLGVAGFTSIVLILASALTFGMYIALRLM